MGEVMKTSDLPTLIRLKPEHLFMLCEWNSGERLSEARSPTEGDPEIKKKIGCKWCNHSYPGALFVNKK